eukprot:1786325-Alexandrium_andersonii.AAC.1
MSLRCWTCDGLWPRAVGHRLCRSRPPRTSHSPMAIENAARHLKGLIRTSMLALQGRIQGE